MDSSQRPARSRRTGPSLSALLLLLLAPPLLWGMHRLDRGAQQEIKRSLRQATGLDVSFSSLETTLAPGMALRDLQLSHRGERLLRVPRIDITLGLQGASPRLRRVALVRPSLTLDLTQVAKLVVPAPKPAKSGPKPQNARRHLAGPLAGTQWSVHQGEVELLFRSPQSLIRLHARDVFLLPRGARRRLVTGLTRVRLNERPLLTVASAALEFEGTSIRRGGALGGTLHLPGGGTLQLLTARLERSSRGLRLRATTRSPRRRGGRLLLSATLQGSIAAPRLSSLEVQLRDLALAGLAPVLEPHGVRCGALRASGLLRLHREPGQRAGVVRVDTNLTLQGLHLDVPQLAPRPLHPGNLRIAGAAHIDVLREQLAIPRLNVALGALQARLRGTLGRRGGRPAVDLELSLPPTPCQAALASLPRGLTPKLEGMALSGRLGAQAHLRLDPARPIDEGQVAFRFAPLGCRVRVDPPQANVRALRRGGAAARVVGGDGRRHALALDRGNPFFVPMGKISRHLRHAFVAAEDQRFFRHEGFDKEQLQRAFLRNLAEGRFGRGASTISQQLVKNLFLDHRRTISRKLQEAVLTWRMEQVLSKRRILELYLNIVEMGPGVHGVEQAARRYFASTARKLDPLQAAHLAALTPSPRPLAQRFRHRQPGRAWHQRLHRVLRQMRFAGWLSKGTVARLAKRQLKLRVDTAGKRLAAK